MPNNHSLSVMALAMLSLIGGTPYLASPPIRDNNSMALILNQAEWKLRFKLYLSSLNLKRLAAAVRLVEG